MLVRVGQAAKIRLAAMTSRVIESLLSSLNTRSSRTMKLAQRWNQPKRRVILSLAVGHFNHTARLAPGDFYYDAFRNPGDGRRVLEYIDVGHSSRVDGSAGRGALSLFKLGLTKLCFVSRRKSMQETP